MSQLTPSVNPALSPTLRGPVKAEAAVVPPSTEDTREVTSGDAAPLPVPSLRAWIITLAVASALVALDLDVPVLRPVAALFTLLAAPAYLLFHKLDLPRSSTVATSIYAFGTALLGLLVIGLGLNTVMPTVGVDRPLQPLVLAVTWFVLDLALVAWRPRRLPTDTLATIGGHLTGARVEPAQGLASAAVVLAVAGAIRLNNGAGGEVAVAAHVLAVAAVLALLVSRKEAPGRDARTLALVALALLLSTSLRGWSITGHDIQAEYFAFSLTNDAQHWSMDLLQNAYNACLSVTVLPTALSQATGLSGGFVFEVLLQLVFALVPVLTFVFARRFLPRRLALVAAVLVIAFPTFYTDMPYLVRQEIAFFFLALMLVAATEPQRRSWRAVALTAVFGVGVVLSHYSTTYLLMSGLVVGLLLWGIVTVVRRRRGGEAGERMRSLVLLNPVLVALLALGSWAWAGPVTETGGHAEQVAREAIAALFGDEAGPASSDVSFFLLAPDDTTPRERLNMFVDDTMDARKQVEPGQMVVEKPGRAELRPDILRPKELPFTSAGHALESVGLDPSTLYVVLRIGAAVLFQVLLLAGLAQLLRRARREALGDETDHETDDAHHGTDADDAANAEDVTEADNDETETATADDETEADNGETETATADAPTTESAIDPDEPTGFSRELACVSFGAVGVLGLIVLIPPLSVEYGVLRAFQQTLLVVAPVIAAGLWFLVKRFRARTALVVAVPVVLLLVLSGTLPSLLGGNPPRLAMANSGLYHDRYLAADSDLESAAWLVRRKGDQRRPLPTVNAQRNHGLRMVADGLDPDEVVDWMYPTMLTRGSYVLVDAQLARKHRGTVFYSGDLITYAYPQQDLDRHLDLVYSAGRSRVYR